MALSDSKLCSDLIYKSNKGHILIRVPACINHIEIMYDPLNHIPIIPMLMDCFAMGSSHRHSLGLQAALLNATSCNFVLEFLTNHLFKRLESPDGKRTKIHLALKHRDILSKDC